jgi:hypothetical protein
MPLHAAHTAADQQVPFVLLLLDLVLEYYTNSTYVLNLVPS